MCSAKSRLYYLFRRFGSISTAYRHSPFPLPNASVTDNLPPTDMYRFLRIKSFSVRGQVVYDVRPLSGGVSEKNCVLYFHGGTVSGFSRKHWRFIGTVTHRTGSTFIVPDYIGLSMSVSERRSAAAALYEELAAAGEYERFVFMGDSAGGGFALSLAERMIKNKFRVPDKLILLSPWFGAEHQYRVMPEENIGPVLNVGDMELIGIKYAKCRPENTGDSTAVTAPVRGLCPVALFAGTRDILLADCRRFCQMCSQQGVPLSYYEYRGMGHAWMLNTFRESRQAVGEICREIESA